MNTARPTRFRQVLGPATPHLVRATRWPAIPTSWVMAAVFLGRSHVDPDLDAIVVSMLVAGGLSFVVADPAAVTLASSPTARFDRLALRLALTVVPATVAWAVLLRVGASTDVRPLPDGDAWLLVATFTALVLVAELWFGSVSTAAGLIGTPTLLAVQVVALQLPARLAIYPVAHHRWRWVIGLVLLGVALMSALRDPARVRAGRAPRSEREPPCFGTLRVGCHETGHVGPGAAARGVTEEGA